MAARTVIDTYGRKGQRGYVRVFKETANGASVVRVEFRKLGKRRIESFDDTRKGIAEAKAFAKGVHDEQTAAPAKVTDYAPLTLRELRDRHVAAKTSEWRANTLRLLYWRWDKLELYMPDGQHTPAASVTREDLDGLKNDLLKKHSPNQVRMAIKAVTSVFRWGVDRDLIPPTKLVTYTAKFSKDVENAAPKMGEFSATDRAKIMAALDPRDSRQWRAWALSTLFAYCAPRQTAARHLEWPDIDFAAGTIRWRPETDKMGGERVQPMPEPVRDAFWVAYGWRIAQGYTGRFVFYSAKQRMRADDRPFTYQGYAAALDEACGRAKVNRDKYQGAHAFRRGVATDIHERTGSTRTAADWIGDKSVKVVDRHYIKTRQEGLKRTADLVGGLTSTANASATREISNATKRNGPTQESEAEDRNPINRGSTDD